MLIAAICTRLDRLPSSVRLSIDSRLTVTFLDAVSASGLAAGFRHAGRRPQISRQLGLQSPTVREAELLSHLAKGLLFKEAATLMGVSAATAREYWVRIKTKWPARTVAAAVTIWAEEFGNPSPLTRVRVELNPNQTQPGSPLVGTKPGFGSNPVQTRRVTSKQHRLRGPETLRR